MASLLQHERLANVRVGSLTYLATLPRHVCFTPTSGLSVTALECPLRATERKSLSSFDHLSGARKVWHAAGALLIRSNNMGTGSDPDVPPQVTVKVLGYFEET